MRTSSQSSFSRSSLVVRAARVLTPLAIMLGAGLATQASAQVDNRFTYQGELRDGGVPVDGVYDLRFRLYNASVGPAQVGPQVSVPAVAVVGGRFNAEVNFGPGVYTGTQLWVEIDSRPAGGGAYTTLAPRQRLNATPFAAYALTANSAATATSATTANNALNLGGQPPSFYTNAANLNAGSLPGARLAGNYANALNLTNVGNVFFGSGANLTGINATNISSGTLSDALLSANIARRNVANTFAGVNTHDQNAIFNTNIGLRTASPLYPLHIVDTGGYAQRIENDGGATLAGGIYAVIDSTTTKYGFLADLNGVTNTVGYNFWANNNGAGGRGFYAAMTDTTGGTGGTTSSYGVYITNAGPNGYGGYFNNTSTTGTTYGLYAENNSPNGYGLFALHDATTGTGPAVYGRTDSTSGNAFAIHGVVNTSAAGAFASGMRGENLSTTGGGIGVWGSHLGGGWGVYGTSVDGIGVYGRTTGTGEAVYGFSQGGYGGYFDTGVAGGPALYVVGTASVGVITIRGGADLAEKFEFNCQSTEILPGMVVMIDDEHDGGMELATGAYNKRVAGVISGAKELAAGMVLGDFEGAINPHAVALTGRVWTYVDASEKAVEAGDLLTTSNTPGYAMPVVDSDRAHGAIIGKAMTKLNKGEKGMVLVLVNLQ